MRYRVVNLGVTEAEWLREHQAFKERLQTTPTFGAPPPPSSLKEAPIPKGLSDQQLSKICDLVDTAMNSESERDRDDAGETIRSWMQGLWGDVGNPGSDKGKFAEYIKRYCPKGSDFLVVWKPQFVKCPPGQIQTREGKCIEPVGSPPPLPTEPPLVPTGAPIPTRDITPLEKRSIVLRPSIATPSTIAEILPPGVLDSFCQVVKAILEDPDPRAQEIYAAEFKKLVDRYTSMIAVIMEYLVRNCDPKALTAWDRAYKPVPPRGPSVATPSRRPLPTVPLQQPVGMVPTSGVTPRPSPRPGQLEVPAPQQPIQTPGSPFRPPLPLPDVETPGSAFASLKPFQLGPTGDTGIPVPGTARAPVASTMCPPGEFWDGRQCRGSIAPGAASLVSAAGGLAPGGATMTPGGLTPGGMPTFTMSGLYPVVNL